MRRSELFRSLIKIWLGSVVCSIRLSVKKIRQKKLGLDSLVEKMSSQVFSGTIFRLHQKINLIAIFSQLAKDLLFYGPKSLEASTHGINKFLKENEITWLKDRKPEGWTSRINYDAVMNYEVTVIV